MVAVFIFSVGILAITALQFLSKQSNFEAIQRSNAALLSYEMFERMRMNSLYQAASTAVGAATVSTLIYYVPGGDNTINKTTPSSKPTPDCSAATCTQAELADWDIYEFQQMMLGSAETKSDDDTVDLGGLVDPTACISGPTAGDGMYTISIVWRGQVKLPQDSSVPNFNTCGGNQYDDEPDDYAFRRMIETTSYLH